jgi:hypothetical protein
MHNMAFQRCGRIWRKLSVILTHFIVNHTRTLTLVSPARNHTPEIIVAVGFIGENVVVPFAPRIDYKKL